MTALNKATPDHDGVWPENVKAVEAFLAVQTQMNIIAGPAGSRSTGLDYAGAQAGFALAGMTISPSLWLKVRAVEQGARAGLNGDPL